MNDALTRDEAIAVLKQHAELCGRTFDEGVLLTEPAWSSFQVEETAKGPRFTIKIYFTAGSDGRATEALALYDKLQKELSARRTALLE